MSPYFRSALTCWVEGQTRQIDLSKAPSEAALDMTLTWMYRQNLCPAQTGDESPNWFDLVDVWIFADYLRMPALQNHVIDVMVSKANQHGDDEGGVPINPRAWDTMDGSPLQRLFLDLMCSSRYCQYIGHDPVTCAELPAWISVNAMQIWESRYRKQREEVGEDLASCDEILESLDIDLKMRSSGKSKFSAMEAASSRHNSVRKIISKWATRVEDCDEPLSPEPYYV